MAGRIYALSDIHGCASILKSTIRTTLSSADAGDTVVFLGDYIDGGKKSAQVLYEVRRFAEESPAKVVCLRGNHDDLFLDWIFDRSSMRWSEFDADKRVIKTFLPMSTMLMMRRLSAALNRDQLDDRYRREMRELHRELFDWMDAMPLYYETEEYIFVHAGVEERLGAGWRESDRAYMLWSSDMPRGRFIKTVVAGHNRSSQAAGDDSFHDVFYDGESHYYIDGDTVQSGRLPVLILDS